MEPTRDPVTGEDIRGLRQDTQALKGSVDEFATKADVADAKRLSKRANVNSALAVIAILLVALIGFVGWQSNSSTLDRFERDRKDRTLGSCVQWNANQRNTREAIINGLVDTFRPLVTPGKEAQLEQFAAALRTNVEKQLPYRDCSPDGIEAFLRNPPPDPNSSGG